MEFSFDEKGEEILLKDGRYQVMMAWEKPYMEACIDALKPAGDVLEIGFGLGYSAERIQFYHPKTHTIIECDPVVAHRAKQWAQKHRGVVILETTWQQALPQLGHFDAIFFDDYPLEPSSKTEEEVAAAASAASLILQGNQWRQEQERKLPQMNLQRYSDEDLSGFINSISQEDKEFFPKFLLELYQKGQVTKLQMEKYLSSQEDSFVESTPSLEGGRSDRLFDFLLPCLENHMQKGSRFSCYLESAVSKYEDPLFQRYIIENPCLDYTEHSIMVNVPEHCRYFSGGKALVITITKQI